MKKIAKITLGSILFLVLLIPISSTNTIFAVSTASGQNSYNYLFPIFFNTQNIIYVSPSYYVTTLNGNYLNNLGCELGTRDRNLPGSQDSVVVLAFGCPRCLKNGEFGANLFGINPATLIEVSTAVKQFASGYYRCTGNDYSSNLVIGVGTSNYPGGTAPCISVSSANAHGKAWSAMVSEINNWLKSQGLFGQVQTFGASDIELGWNSPEWSRAWVNGYNQVSGNFFLHFGDAAGCPYQERPAWSCGTSSFPSWTMEDVWYVSFGASPALPLPLIYLTTGVHAKQWAYLSQYSVNKHGYRMDFTGVFTQWGACQQMGGCNFTDNSPDAAYQQLISELNKNQATAQYLPWKTDINWVLNRGVSSEEFSLDAASKNEFTNPLKPMADNIESAMVDNSLSPALKASFEDKLAAYQQMTEMVEQSRINPADKVINLGSTLPGIRQATFEDGLISRGEIPGRPYSVEIINVWQAQVEEGFIQVAAGSAPDDPNNGAIYVVSGSFDRTTFKNELHLAPNGCGILEIVEEIDDLLYIHSTNDCRFTFSISEQTLKLIDH